MTFQSQRIIHFVQQIINVNKNEIEWKMKNTTDSFRETNLVLQLI